MSKLSSIDVGIEARMTFLSLADAGLDYAAERRHESVSLFFPAGDFVEAIRRHKAGEQQSYATHTEVARLLMELSDEGIAVTVYTFISPARSDVLIGEKLRFISLGADRWDQTELLIAALREDRSSALIPHFPNLELIYACLNTGREVMVAMASSYNKKGLKAWLERRRLARALSDKRISIIINHCQPSTQKLADYGVARNRLVPWDIPHAFSPDDFPAKSYPEAHLPSIAYAGSISESKGVGDFVRAIGLLRESQYWVRATCAGAGDISAMQRLAFDCGVADQINFLGVIGNRDVVTLFKECDLVCVPSRHDFPEGFPLTMFEAIASRSPIICSDHPMFRPIMLSGRRAEMFTAGNAQSLAKAIRSALASKEHYEALSRNADETWQALKGPADWRQLVGEWIRHGSDSEWIKSRTLAGSVQRESARLS